MRFNSKELSIIACQPRERFDKEGVLQVKEKQEGLFRKGEAYVERLFRLRGNLLFYFKTKDASSEVVGVIVLERCFVQLNDDDPRYYSFQIIFEGDENEVRLATNDERERDGWIERIHIASYECMRIQLNSLRDQIKDRTGRDPIESGGLAVDTSSEPSAADICKIVNNEDPSLEMCLACHDLMDESGSRAPDTYAVIYYQMSVGSGWTVHAHTEIVEQNCSPVYLTTFGFNSPVNVATRIKIVVFDVKERLTNTMTPLGHAMFTLASVLSSVSSSIVLRLNSLDGSDVGSLSVMAWDNEVNDVVPCRSSSSLEAHSKEVGTSIRTSRILSAASLHRRQGVSLLKGDYANVFTKTFRFPVNSSISGAPASSDQQLIVHEYLAESRLTYHMPIQLLKLYVEEERNKIDQLEILGALTDENDRLRKQLADYRLSCMESYKQHINYLSSFKGTTYLKASAKKNHKEVEFAPTNLHLQRMSVCQGSLASTNHDVITVGVFTASSQKYKHGGLRRMLQKVDQAAIACEASSEAAAASVIAAASVEHSQASSVTETLCRLTDMHQTANTACDNVCLAALLGDNAALVSATSRLTEQVKHLIEACEVDLVSHGIESFKSAHVVGSNPPPARNSSSLTVNRPSDVGWKWSGTDFVKSPTEEPWEMTKLNTQAELMCVMSKVDELTDPTKGCATQWLDNISPLIIKLKRCIEVMCSRANIGLTFMAVQDCGKNMAVMQAVNYRRDIVFSQAVSSATAGFITKVKENLSDSTFHRQLVQIGMLMEFESLISCYGDEMGMLEDMDVAIRDLANVSYRIEKRNSIEDEVVSISGTRYTYTITVRIDENEFNVLPMELRDHHIQLVPIVFSIGINEQATLADKIGYNTLQDTVNLENYQRLCAYYESFLKFNEKLDQDLRLNVNAKLEQLFRHLYVCVNAKKSKNVDVLTLANEICIVMRGMRFTGCKSAKDRTAMAVTLEQVRLLQSEHGLAPDVFMHALECFRSEGVRRENAYKNTGAHKYAFNSIQLRYLPKLYRPPAGTYGSVET